MFNFRVIARVFSQVIIIEGLFMMLAAAVSFFYNENAGPIMLSAIITTVTGVLVFTPLRNEERLTGNKEGYIVLTGFWLILSLFGTLPYLLSGSVISFTDAFFESMSGFTTTGATILTNIESHPQGILFWRSLTQWLGGIGFILISLSLLPVVKSLNIQLTMTDFTGQAADKIHPRVSEASKRLIIVYLALTIAEVILLSIGGMPVFDAVCHSMTTISTGGFSTRSDGVASFGSPLLLVILTIFMFLAGTNMTLIYFGFKRNFRKITGNNEFIFYTITCLVFLTIVSLVLLTKEGYAPGKAFLEGSFHVISIITTTGFYAEDYNLWGSFLVMLIFILMFTGGTSGSASSSLKIIRLLLMTRNARHEIKRMIHPSAVVPVRLDSKVIPDIHIYNLLVFTVLYFLFICLSSIVISFMNYDIITSISTSAAFLGNIGPALGNFGPFTTYSAVPVAGKWFFSFLMLIGRLELFTVLVLLSAGFYRR
jgi:trk system potassium uptake protein TrkH